MGSATQSRECLGNGREMKVIDSSYGCGPLRGTDSGYLAQAMTHRAQIMIIEVAETNEQIAACFPVMLELRQHLRSDTFRAHDPRDARGRVPPCVPSGLCRRRLRGRLPIEADFVL